MRNRYLPPLHTSAAVTAVPGVAGLTHLDTSTHGKVAKQTRQNDGHHTHTSPSEAPSVRVARTRLVSARRVAVRVVVRAVVEHSFDTTHAGTQIHQGLGRTFAFVLAYPGGGQRSRIATCLTLTPAALVADDGLPVAVVARVRVHSRRRIRFIFAERARL